MPPWTETNLKEILTGAWWLLLGILGWLGARAGINRSTAPALPPVQPGETHVEVAGALIDTKRMDDLIDQIGLNTVNLSLKAKSIEANTNSMNGLVVAIQMARNAVEKHTQATADFHRHAEEIVREMRELRTEMRELRDETKDLRDEMLRGGRPRN